MKKTLLMKKSSFCSGDTWLLAGIKPIFTLLLLFYLSWTQAQAQPLSKAWDRRFGGTDYDVLYSVTPTSDGGFLLGGYSFSEADGDKSQAAQGESDYWVVKIDANGNKLWDKRFGGSYQDNLQSVTPTSDGGFLLGGASYSEADGDKSQASQGLYDYWVVKIDANGNKLWDKRFGGTGNDVLKSVTPASDGGFLLGGYSDSGAEGDKSQASQGDRGAYDYWVVKIDDEGNKLWDRRFGGTYDDLLLSVTPTSDGGFLLGGDSDSGADGDKSQASQGRDDYWVVKIDANGNKLWDKRFGGTDNDVLLSVTTTSDGGFLLGGTSFSEADGDKSQASWGSSDYWVVKIDANGNKLWDKRFGGTSTDLLQSVTASPDGGFLLGGRSSSEADGDKSQASWGSSDYWVVKIDANGNKLWDKRFGGTDYDDLYSVTTTSDGGFLLGGTSGSGADGDKSQASQGDYDYWVVKMSEELTATITPNTAQIVCSGATLALSGGSTNGISPTYTWSSSPAGFSSNQQNPSFTVPTVASSTEYTLTLTVTEGDYTATATVQVTVNPLPTTANAGPDQTGAATCGLTQVTLAANTPAIGTGSWSIQSGTGGSFGNASSPTSTFTGTAGSTYTLRWTISNNPCTASTDEVVITFNQNPTTANAGPNQTGAATCGLTQVTLAANTPAIGTGSWSIQSGTGGSFGNASSPTSTFTGTAGSTYTLRWTISNNPCTASTDEVVITFNQNPTTANAGPDQTGTATCGLTQVTLAANTPAVGTGSWSIQSGTGGSFGNTASPTSGFTGTAGSTYTLRWTISNSPCTASTDQVVITFNPTPNAVATPSAQTICSAASITTIALSGNVSGTVYNWTRDNTANVTGISANGSGNISGSLTNTTNTPITVTFTITPTANGCPGTPITATVLVNPTPNAVATPSSQTICSAASITMIVLSGNVDGTAYNWSRDNTANVTGIPANGSGNISGSLTNTTNAPVTVTFTITPTANGCPGTPITSTVIVNPLPTAGISGTTAVCQNAPFPQITFTGSNGTTPYTFTYKINGGPDQTITTSNGTGVSISQTTAAAGVFEYTLVSVQDANGCSQSQSGTATITVNAPPVVSTPQTELCTGLTMTLSPTSGGTWLSSNPSRASVTNAGVVTAIAPGTVNFTFTATATGCSSTTENVLIKQTPSSNLTASKVDVCPNTEVSLNPNCSIPTATVNWNPGAPTVTPDAATIPYLYKASCVADGCVGNESSVEVRTHRILVDMKDLDVGTLPLPIARPVKDNMAPTNQIQAPVFPRRWTFIANGCEASESAVFKLSGPVNFNAIDNAAAYAMFANDAGGFYSIDHPNYGNGGSFPNGTYTLTVDLRSADGVGGPFPKNRVATGSLLATRTLQFTVSTPSARIGAGEFPVSASEVMEPFARVSPNPISNTLHLQVSGAAMQKVNVRLLDASGRSLLQRDFVPQSNQHQEEFEVSHLTHGMYFIRVNTDQIQATLKVIKVQ